MTEDKKKPVNHGQAVLLLAVRFGKIQKALESLGKAFEELVEAMEKERKESRAFRKAMRRQVRARR